MNLVFTTQRGFVIIVPVAPAAIAAKMCTTVVSASPYPTHELTPLLELTIPPHILP